MERQNTRSKNELKEKSQCLLRRCLSIKIIPQFCHLKLVECAGHKNFHELPSLVKSSDCASLKNPIKKMNDHLWGSKRFLMQIFFFFHCLSLLSLMYFKGNIQMTKKFCSSVNITGLSSVFWESGNLCF